MSARREASLTSVGTDRKQPNSDKVVSEGEFHFAATGDSYSGGFEAKRKDRIVTRIGVGTYNTWDNHSYKAVWRADTFVEDEKVEIIFPDGSRYEGVVNSNNLFQGDAIYTFADNSNMKCSFLAGVPMGDLTFKDAKGHIWTGSTEDDTAILIPRNHYFNALQNKNATSDSNDDPQ